MSDWQNLEQHEGLVVKRIGKPVPTVITFAELFEAWPVDSTLAYWKNHGRRHYKNMSKAAAVILSATGSAAQLERDYSDAGQWVHALRSRLGDEQVEMGLFCKVNGRALGTKFNPDEFFVEKLDEEKAKKAVPLRLSQPRAEVRLLDEDEEARELRELMERMETAPAQGAAALSAEGLEEALDPMREYDLYSNFMSFGYWGGDERAASRWDHNLRGPGAGGARPREEGGEGDGAPPSSRPRTG